MDKDKTKNAFVEIHSLVLNKTMFVLMSKNYFAAIHQFKRI